MRGCGSFFIPRPLQSYTFFLEEKSFEKKTLLSRAQGDAIPLTLNFEYFLPSILLLRDVKNVLARMRIGPHVQVIR